MGVEAPKTVTWAGKQWFVGSSGGGWTHLWIPGSFTGGAPDEGESVTVRTECIDAEQLKRAVQ